MDIVKTGTIPEVATPTPNNAPKEWMISPEGWLVISEGGKVRIPTLEEMTRAVALINEESVTAVKIFCKTSTCPGFNSWIQRTRQDIAKTVYTCEQCRQPMTR